MADKVLTNEELEAHVDKYLAPVQKAATGADAAAGRVAAADVLPNVCAAYKLVKPILQAVLAIPFLSKKIKDAIKVFLKVLDAICP